MARRRKGRQRVYIVKMKNESSLQVTFSKRRAGIFKKASELCTLCGAEIAIVVFFPEKKVYSFGHPSVELLVDRFLGRNLPPPNNDGRQNHLLMNHRNVVLRELNKEVMNMEEILQMEKAHGESIL
ncbi:Agamous-like MADS-box protein AGL62 [Capsicum baccatum]|uniref:Agamous-like MADS-box protein AGL62 n=1 Tax=Capsicum baccatum TaxID=33114 RepID=A0A2G2WDS1_CAPBA|nr:Agamous-like MADS-box protein AGL62 [Capsicum baccatum]